MISILAEVQDVYEINSPVDDLLSSFGQPNLEGQAILKLKKNRRRHMKDRRRMQKIGVLKRS